MADIPHFDLPFRFVGGKAVVAEQDSLRDIQNCAEAVIRTHIGEREGLPEFGIPDPTFQVVPINTADIVEQIEEWEPRADATAEERPDWLEPLIDRILIQVVERSTPA